MRREWELEALLDWWTLDEQELALLANKSGATRLGFGLKFKYFELEARFPRREDIPRAAVEFMAGQVKVDAALFAFYDFTSRTAVNHRTQIREYHKFEEPTVGDEDKLVVWLASDICPTEISRDRLRTALLTRCREVRIEPPTPGRIERLLGAAESMFERQFTETTLDRLSPESIEKLEELIVPDDPGADDEDEADTGEASSSAERAAEEDTDSGAGDAQEEDTADEGDKAEGVGGRRAGDVIGRHYDDDQVRDRVAAQDRRGPPDAAPLHPRRPQTPDLPGCRRAGPCDQDDLYLRISRG